MSIRYLAQELYRLERAVEETRKRVGAAAGPRRDDLEFELRRLIAQRNDLRSRLEAKKDDTPRRVFR